MAQLNGTLVSDRTQVDHLVERLNDPRTATALNSLLDNVELLAVLLSGLDGLARKGEVIGDTVAEVLAEVRAAGAATGMDVRTTTQQLATLIPVLAEAAPSIQRIISSPIVEPEPIAVLSDAAEALVKGLEVARANGTKVGLLGLAKATRDPDVQSGLGFMLEVARVFGHHMASPPPTTSERGA